MNEQGPYSTIPPSSRRIRTSVREDDINSAREAFIESFPPPSIVLTPRTVAPSTPPQLPYRVLVACDLSEFSEGVLREAFAFAHGHMPAELHLVTVLEKAKDLYLLHSDDKRRKVSREIVESLMTDLVWKVGVPKGSPLEDVLKNVSFHICVGDTAEEILKLSREIRSDLIVAGSREHDGLKRRVWGSVSKTIMTHADCSVVLSRPIDFVHGHRTPTIEPPKSWTSESHHLQPHRYYTTAAAPKTMPHVL